MNIKNIILIIAEELRADCVGIYGNSAVKTPNIDNLAKGGVIFKQHYTNHTKCVPARVNIYSGRYANLGGHRTLGIMLQPGEENFASLLKSNGYYTALFKKNHTVDEKWKDKVFDLHCKVAHTHHIKNPSITSAESKAFYWGIIENPDYVSSDEVHTNIFIEWLKSYKEKIGNRPFFVNFNFENAHPPYNCAKKFAELYDLEKLEPFPNCEIDNKPLYVRTIQEFHGDLKKSLTPQLKKRIIQAYYGQISECDYLTGKIISTLKGLKIWDDTIFIFIADHGDYVGQYDLVEKWDTGFEDCLIHVPFVISGGGLPEAIEINGFTEHVDILPTICEILGIEIPYGVSGQSFQNMIKNPDIENKKYVYCEGGHEKELLKIFIKPEEHSPVVDSYQDKAKVRNVYPDTLRKAKMIRTKRYKYIYRVVEQDELYDLEKDPNELTNIAFEKEYDNIKMEMKEILLKHLIENEEKRPFDPFPIA